MWLKSLKDFEWRDGWKMAGQVFEMAYFFAPYLIGMGLVEETEEPTAHIEVFHARLNNPAPALFLPFIGEFGHQLAYHVRMVHFHKAARKIVCVRRGMEVLYPSADEFEYTWADPIDDSKRCGTGDVLPWPDLVARYPAYVPIQGGGLTHRQEWDERFIVEPNRKIPFAHKRRGLHVDVCIGTRSREFLPWKNWRHAQTIADWCMENHLSFAVIGTRASSYPLIGQTCMSGDYGDVDAAIELLENCRLFVSTDSGSAHLAATVGARMVVQCVPNSRCYCQRMRAINPGRVTEIPAEEWGNPAAVLEAIDREMSQSGHAKVLSSGALKI
jgi:hypothetical protein